MIGFLPAIRRVLGEKAAMSAWKVFMRSILVFGCEVMVWDRCGVRNKMDNVNKKALRGILGLDRGSSNNLVLGEAEEILISEEVKWMTARYGCAIGKMKDDNILKKVLKLRDSNSKDRWAKYMNAVIEEVDVKDVELGDLCNIGEDYNQEWKNRIERISFRKWKEGMERSEGSLEIYKRVVVAKGEMDRWDMLEGELKTWWRRFRGGLMAGKRRANRWSSNKCLFCEEGEGKIGHIILRCEKEEVKFMREVVVGSVHKILQESEKDEDKEKWEKMSDEEKLYMTLGDGLMKWKEERLMKEIPYIYGEGSG
jgi:hypothetical protein